MRFKLWTFQSLQSAKLLQTEGILRAKWDWYSDKDPYRSAYKWMAGMMKQRGLMAVENPPIWAWHSCGAYENPPTLKVARALLSDVALEMGIVTITMECPMEKVLLSNYGIWNEIIDWFIDHPEKTFVEKDLEEQLFHIAAAKMEADDSIQATLPYLKKEWVTDIRPLTLKRDDFDFDSEETV